MVIDYPTGSPHSENLWSRANIDLYYFNKNYTGIIPPYKLSFIIESALREPLAVLSGSSLNTYKWCSRSFKLFVIVLTLKNSETTSRLNISPHEVPERIFVKKEEDLKKTRNSLQG